MRKKTVTLGGLLIALLLISSGCAPREPVREDQSFTLGVLGPFSGPDAEVGAELRVAAQLALEHETDLLEDATFDVIWINSQSDPELAAKEYEKAILQEGVDVGALGWDSAVAMSVMEVVGEHQVPHIFGLSSTPAINDRFKSDPTFYGYWTTKGRPTPASLSGNYVRALERAIAEGDWSPQRKTAAIYGEDTDWGRYFGENLATLLEQADWEVGSRRYYSLEQTDFSNGISELEGEKPTLLAGTMTSPRQLRAFLDQIEGADLQPLIIAEGAGSMDVAGGGVPDYILDQDPGWLNANAGSFSAEFQARTGHLPNPTVGGLSYDGMRFTLKVLRNTWQRGDGLSSKTVYRTVQDHVWRGELTFGAEEGAVVMPAYDFRQPPDPRVGADYYVFPVVQFLEGEARTIWPEAVAGSGLMFPNR